MAQRIQRKTVKLKDPITSSQKGGVEREFLRRGSPEFKKAELEVLREELKRDEEFLAFLEDPQTKIFSNGVQEDTQTLKEKYCEMIKDLKELIEACQQD